MRRPVPTCRPSALALPVLAVLTLACSAPQPQPQPQAAQPQAAQPQAAQPQPAETPPTATTASPDALVPFRTLDVQALNHKLQGAAQVFVFDVNSQERYDKGHVPGAVHMTPETLDAAKLPPNKAAMLVFYCGGPRCKASHRLAEKVHELGYTNLWILPDGIRGWEEAGLPTEPPRTPDAPTQPPG